MKAKYIFIGLALATLLCACNRDEESLFDRSAAERAQDALDNMNTVLIAPANGWEMIYFANTASRGYNLIVKFDENGCVSATAKNATTTGGKIVTDVSTWDVKLDYGPILTFDTYNKVLHAWADPREDGDGLLGDYEFLILHADANYIKLKGKKHSAYCYLYPMEEGKSAADYYTDIEAAEKKMCGNGNIFHLSAQDKEYMLYDGSTGIFTLTELGEIIDPETVETYPLAIRKNGIQLCYPFLDLNDTSYELDGSVMRSAKSMIATAAPTTYFAEYVTLAGGSWVINLEDINPTTLEAITAVTNALKKAYSSNKKAGVQGLRFKLVNDNVVLILSFYGSSSKVTEMNYIYQMESQDNSLKLTYSEPADENAQKVLSAFPSLETLLNTFNGNFAASSTDALNPTTGIKLENASAATWFNATGKIE